MQYNVAIKKKSCKEYLALYKNTYSKVNKINRLVNSRSSSGANFVKHDIMCIQNLCFS